MRYIKVYWNQSDPEHPILLYSEIDDFGWERRKVEVFASGECSYASEMEETGTTILGLDTVPPLSEIAKNPEFEPSEITAQEFEDIWVRAKSSKY